MKKYLLFTLLFISTVLQAKENIDYFKEGKNYFENGKYYLAINRFKILTDKIKVKNEVFLYLARAAYKAKNYKLANTAFKNLFKKTPYKEYKRYLLIAAESSIFSNEIKITEKYLKLIKKFGISINRNRYQKLISYINYKKRENTLLKNAQSMKRIPLLNLARFYREQNYIYLAAKYYLKAFSAENKKDASVTNEFANFLLKRGLKYQAKQFLLKSIEANAFDRYATYNLGKMYFKEGKYLKSANMFKKMKRVDNSYIPYLYLGEIYANTSGAKNLSQSAVVTKAINYLKEAEKRGARNEKVYLLLSYLYRNIDEAQYKKYLKYAKVFKSEIVTNKRLKTFRNIMKINRLKELVSIFQNDIRLKDILFDLAKAYADTEQYVNSKQTIKKVIKIDNSNFDYFHILGYCHYKLGEFEKAIIELKKSLKLNPRAAKSYYYLSQIYKKGEYKNKSRYYKNLLLAYKYSPNNVKYIKELAHYYLNKNQLFRAYRLYKKLVKLRQPFKKLLRKIKLKIKLKKLENDFSWGDSFKNGLKPILDARLELNPSDKRISNYLKTAKEKNKFNKQRQYYSALYNYALFCKYFKEKFLNKSISILQKLVLEYPFYSDAYYLMGMIYLKGRVDIYQAKNAFTSCLKITNGYDKNKIKNIIQMIETNSFDEIGNLVKIGRSIFRITKNFYSLDYLIRAHNKNEKNLRLLLILGEIYKKKGEYGKAIFYYKKAIKINTWNPGVYLALGNACFSKFLYSPKNMNDFNLNYDPDRTFPNSSYALSKLRKVLNKAKNEAVKAFKTYIQQRMPFVVHDLHPNNPANLVRYLENINLNDEYIYKRIGDLLLKNGKIYKSISTFKNLLKKTPKNKGLLKSLLRAYKAANDKAGITNTYTRLIKLFPRETNILLEAGNFYNKHNNPIKALEYYSAAYKIKKKSKIEILLGKLYYKMKNYNEAEKYFEKAISKLKIYDYIKYPSLFYKFAKIKKRKNDLNLTLNFLKISLTGIKQHIFTDEFNNNKNKLHDIYNTLASLHLYAGKYRKAFSWLIEACIFDPVNKHEYQAKLGDILFLNKRFKYAISYYKKSLKIKKKDKDILLKIAVCYKNINQIRRSLKVLKKMETIFKNKMQTEALLFFGDIYILNKNYKKAYYIYLKAYRQNSKNYKVYIKLAHALKFLNMPGKAVELIKRNLENIKEKANIYSFLSWYMAERNMNLNYAILWAKKALLLEPKNVTFLKTLSFLYYKSGKILKYFRIAKKIEKLNSIALQIKTDFYNYFYTYEKACGYFKNQNFLLAVAKLYNIPKILKLKESLKLVRNSN